MLTVSRSNNRNLFTKNYKHNGVTLNNLNFHTNHK